MAVYTNSPVSPPLRLLAPLTANRNRYSVNKGNRETLKKVKTQQYPPTKSLLLPPQPLILRPHLSQPLLPLSLLPLRGLTSLSVFLSCHRWAGRPADVCLRGKRVPPGCTAHRLAAPRYLYGPYPGWGREASSSPRPEGLLLAPPLGAVLEQVLPGLDAVLAPPAGGVRSAGCPSQVLAGQAVPRLQLVEPQGEALVGLRHRGVRYLRFLVRASCFLAQPLVSAPSCSKKPRLTFASERGRGNFPLAD